jgi:hypothetical protein
MARNYRGYAYFDNNPQIVKIFDDLEALHDFCRFELLPFNQADLYNKNSLCGINSHMLTDNIKVVTVIIANKETVNDCLYHRP